MRWLRGGVDDELDVRRIFLKNLFKTFQIADVQVVMRVILDLFLEKLLVPGGGSLRAEEIFTHVVVDANDLQPLPGKIPHRLRTDQPG